MIVRKTTNYSITSIQLQEFNYKYSITVIHWTTVIAM